MFRGVLPLVRAALGRGALAVDTVEALERSVQELCQSHGEWAVTAEFLGAGGQVARTAEGGYRFEWVAKDGGATWHPGNHEVFRRP